MSKSGWCTAPPGARPKLEHPRPTLKDFMCSLAGEWTEAA